MNKWFKRFPYLGWVSIFGLFLVSSVFSYHIEKGLYSERQLAAYVQKDFSAQQAAIENDWQRGLLVQGNLDQAFPKLSGPYIVFLVQNGTVRAWNSKNVDFPVSAGATRVFEKGALLHLNNGYYYGQKWPLKQSDSSGFVWTLVPICLQYGIENDNFQSHFQASPRVPANTALSSAPEAGSFAIYSSHGLPAFYLNFRGNTTDGYIAGPITWILTIIALLSLSFWIHECCYGLGLKQGRFLNGWFALVGIVLAALLTLHYAEIPLGFRNAKLFSPELFSSGESVQSLGHLIIMVLLKAWPLVYWLSYSPYWSAGLLKQRQLDIFLKLLISFGLTCLLLQDHAHNMYRLVIDSKISFEVNDISYLTPFNFIGIFTLSLIMLSFLVVIAIINDLLASFLPKYFLKYIVFFAFILLALSLFSEGELYVFYLSIMSTALLGVFFIDTLGLPVSRARRQFELSIRPTTYIWFAILCTWITLEIFYFNYTKEKELRKVFAQKQGQMDDELVAYSFEGLSLKLQKDAMVRRYFDGPSRSGAIQLEKYVNYKFLADYLKKYKIDLFFYDKDKRRLFGTDTSDSYLAHIADSVTGYAFRNGVINMSRYTDHHMYWFLCAIPGKSVEDTLGFVGFDLSLDNRPKIAKQRSFFQKKYHPSDQQYFDRYDYGVYRNGRLCYQAGERIFPYKDHGGVVRDHEFKDSWKSSVLSFRNSPDEVVKVIYNRNLLVDLVSLFSYVLAVLLLLSACVFVLRQVLFYPVWVRLFFRKFNFTIRSKVNLTILVTVFASLLVVGIITLSFINNRYKENQRKSLQSLLFFFTQNINHLARDYHIDFKKPKEDLLTNYSEISYKLNELAEEQGVDVNIYDPHGKLVATSQLELLHKGFVSEWMNPVAMHQIDNGLSELFMEERIGSLNYQSAYMPLRDHRDSIYAYINLPYYASVTDLNKEISNVVMSLINVYSLVFFISGLCAILISNSIIRSFQLLIDQFRNIRLSSNEAIQWPYKDEIGVLVGEYNKMMAKVEDMADKLVKTEREAAWRDIARQVAHEIKNPLTPMKLNIQYLQQALKSGREDIGPLASKVSSSLIEQIENLDLIATGFSNFAKMPEARPEIIDLGEALCSVVALFQNSGHTEVHLKEAPEKVRIWIDKSYFIRIFNNLIQNAIQAAADNPHACVKISYEQIDNEVVIVVTDNGTGISEEMQGKLFVPYFTTKSSGTGIGLAMTKSMVEYSGGRIGFETQIGLGTSFSVTLPLATS